MVIFCSEDSLKGLVRAERKKGEESIRRLRGRCHFFWEGPVETITSMRSPSMRLDSCSADRRLLRCDLGGEALRRRDDSEHMAVLRPW